MWQVAEFNPFQKQQKRLDNTRTQTLCTTTAQVRRRSPSQWWQQAGAHSAHAYPRTSAEKWYLLAGLSGRACGRSNTPPQRDRLFKQGDTRWATTTTTNSSNLLLALAVMTRLVWRMQIESWSSVNTHNQETYFESEVLLWTHEWTKRFGDNDGRAEQGNLLRHQYLWKSSASNGSRDLQSREMDFMGSVP